MFSNEFIAYLDNIQKQNLDKDGYKFIELFETKFIQEKKLFKSHPDKSNSYYFDMIFSMIFSEFPQDNPEIINIINYQNHIKDIIKKIEEYEFKYVRDKNGMNSRMTFNIDEKYHYDNITKIITIRFFFRY
jgi:hypothetical protein